MFLVLSLGSKPELNFDTCFILNWNGALVCLFVLFLFVVCPKIPGKEGNTLLEANWNDGQ